LEQLREAIILGELPAGTPLRLDELARSLGMSISPIREAVRQLEALGLAKHVPHQGARVLDFDIEELRDLFHVRLTLESLAVRRAAERFTPADADAARSHLRGFDAAAATGDVRGTLRAHTDFHFTLYDALLRACAEHDPDGAAQALRDHLELASIIFERELDGRGVFDPR